MITANFHTHTARCGHAVGEDRDYVTAAIAAGIKVLGFSDHTPYVGFGGNYYSDFRMRPEALADYVESVNYLKEEFKDKIEIRLGLEAEYYPEQFEALLDFIKPYGIEYLILGQHFTESDRYGVYAPYVKDEKAAEKYVDLCIEAMNTGVFSYVAHPDIFGLNRSSPKFAALSEKYCVGAKKANLPLELNFLGLSGGRIYPCREFFKIAAETGNEIIYGRDAHRPDAFFDTETEAKADEWTAQLGLERTEKPDLSRLSEFFGHKM